MRASPPCFASRPVTASSVRETAGAALSSAEALTALLSDSIAGRRTPSRRDVSPAATFLSESLARQGSRSPAPTRTQTPGPAKRSMLPAQVWTQQAKADTAFQSSVTYTCGVTINIKELAKVLFPLAQSNPGDLPRVADIVRRRDHIQMSLKLYSECDTQRMGYLEWRDGQLYNFVVSVFRYSGFLPPFSGQVKEVANQFSLQAADWSSYNNELLEARECLCLVDALLQALTYDARSKTSTVSSPADTEVVRRLDNELQASSNEKPDRPLESLIDRIESRLGNHNQMLSSVAGHWSPNRSVPSAASYSPPSRQDSTNGRGAPAETSLAVSTQVPTPQEVQSLVDKAGRLSAGIFDENKPISPKSIQSGNGTYCKPENTFAEKVFRKPYEDVNTGSSSIKAEKPQTDNAVNGSGDSVLSLSNVSTLAPQSEDVTQRILMCQEKILALDKEIAQRDQQIETLMVTHKAEVSQLNKELKNAADELQRKDQIILAKDNEIQELKNAAGEANTDSIEELKMKHANEVRQLERIIARKEEEQMSQLDIILALKKDKDRFKKQLDSQVVAG